MQAQSLWTRPLLFGLLRLLIVPVALVWLLWSFGDLMGARPHVVEPAWLMLAILINQLSVTVFAERLRLILGLCSIRVDRITALRVHLESMFYFFAVPMTVGLEISRFIKFRAICPTSSVTQLAIALALDRLIGAGSALAMALLCLPFVAIKYRIEVSTHAVAAVVAICIVLGAVLLLWDRFRKLVAQFWQMTRGMRAGIVAVFALSMAMHALFAGGVQLAIQALGLPMSFVETVFATAGGMLLVAIPISLAGLGLAEAGAAGIYIALGYAPPIAAIAGALPYLARLVAALEGGIWEIADGGVAAFATMQQMLARKSANRI